MVRYPTGVGTAMSVDGGFQVASRSVCAWMGPVAVDLFCSLVFVSSVTEMQHGGVSAHFPPNLCQ